MEREQVENVTFKQHVESYLKTVALVIFYLVNVVLAVTAFGLLFKLWASLFQVYVPIQLMPIIFIAIILSLFPFFLQRSFEHTKKARIRGDVWTDLMCLGYWTKLNYSASVNSRMGIETTNSVVGRLSRELHRTTSAIYSSNLEDNSLQSNNQVPTVIDVALREFSKRFEEHFGRAAFNGPLLFVTFMYLVGWLSVLTPNTLLNPTPIDPSLNANAGYINYVIVNLNMVTAAFLGAYLFSVQSLFRRYVRSDFKPTAVNQASLRLITACIIAVLLSNLPLKDWGGVNLALGFFSGIFSLEILEWIWERRQKKRTNALHDSGSRARFASLTNAELTQLDGLDSWHKDRLDEAGISYVRGLATVDFLDLLLAVRLSTETLVDWVDQAILRSHISEEAWDQLHKYTPIRTTSDMLDVLSNSSPAEKEQLAKLFSNNNHIPSYNSASNGTVGKKPANNGVDQQDPNNQTIKLFDFSLNALVRTLQQDPNIAFVCMYRKQQSKFVNHPKAFPHDWPISWEEPERSTTNQEFLVVD